MITFDSADPGPLAQWWAEQTGGRIEQDNDGFRWVTLADPDGNQFCVSGEH